MATLLHLAVLLFTLGTTVSAPQQEIPQSVIDEIFLSNNDYTDGDQFIPPSESTFDSFDWRLCQILHKRDAGNLIVSPISLKLMLAMVYEGADNQAAEELRTALGLSEDRLASRDKYFNILQSLERKEPNLVLEVASKMFLRNDLTPRSVYKKILQYIYSADLEQLDFSKSTQAVRTINSWVSKATHGHIESMLDDDVVSPNTMALLLNAIYFKGLWRYPFNPNSTMPGTFQVSPTTNVSAEFMMLAQYLYFSESVELDSKIIRLPYKGNKYSMFIVLPNKADGLNHLLEKVTPSLLRQQMFLMEEVEANLVLPKFKFEFTTELGDVLQEMGIREIFSPSTTNLGGIVRGKSVYVSKVLQKAALEVNEEGTEAYVTTGIVIDHRIGGESVNFYAKHPFMFFIQDEKNGTVIFVGKLVDPTNSDTPLTNSNPQNTSSKMENNSSGENKIQQDEKM